MYYGLYMSAAGAHAQSQQVEVLSNNLANADTVGFKRELSLLEARDSESIERGLAYRGSGTIDDVGGGIRFTATATDFRQGAMSETGNATDFAIETPGAFFAIQRGKEQLLTRAGNFQISTDGFLQTQQGDAVLSSAGDEIQIDPTLPWRLMPGGVVEQGGDTFEIALAKPAELKLLEKVGQNCFRLNGPPPPAVAAEERGIRGGFLELATVNPTEEMVDLIAASRTYEANIRMIQEHDQATSQLISKLLRA
jgi:flagellar basal-body rod protein FlgF/flagellar basal-body rod protein FlgG